MAKLKSQKANKEYKCGKCGGIIAKGDNYYKIEENFRKPRKRCNKCRPERWELTNSEYLQTVWQLQDTWQQDADANSVKDDIISQLEDLKSGCEERLENMPENLQESSSSGQTLQEYIDNLDNAINELEAIDDPDLIDASEVTADEYDDIHGEGAWEKASDEDKEQYVADENGKIIETLYSAIEDALSNL